MESELLVPFGGQMISVITNEHEKGKTIVELVDQDIDDKAAEDLFSKDTSKIETLHLVKNKISHLGLIHFPQAKWDELHILRLWNNEIGDKGCKYLSQARLRKLRALNLNKNQITHLGVMHLSKAEWPSFKEIWLYQNRLSNESIKWLVKGNWGKMLSYYLMNNEIRYSEALQLLFFQPQVMFRFRLGHNHLTQEEIYKLEEILTEAFENRGLNMQSRSYLFYKEVF